MIDGAILRRDGEEFICIDCGIRAFTPVKHSDLCCVCEFVAEQPEDVREALKARLIGPYKGGSDA